MTKKQDNKAGMEYEDVPLKIKKGVGRRYLISEAKQLNVATLQMIVVSKVAGAFGRIVARVSKFLGRITWNFTKKHKFALVVVWAFGMTVVQFLPFLPELVVSTIMGAIS